MTTAYINCRRRFVLKSAHTNTSFIPFRQKQTDVVIKSDGGLSRRPYVRRMVFTCLAKILSSAEPTPPFTVSTASLKIHITPITQTQLKLSRWVKWLFMEGSTQHGRLILMYVIGFHYKLW